MHNEKKTISLFLIKFTADYTSIKEWNTQLSCATFNFTNRFYVEEPIALDI